MTFEEVLPALKSKKQIKRKGHVSPVFLFSCRDEKVRLRKGAFTVNKVYGFTADDILADDWEIVKEGLR